MDGHQFRQVVLGGQLVVTQAEGGYPAILSLHLFDESLSEALQESALDLPLVRQRVDHGAHIMGGDELRDLDLARLCVHLHLSHLGAE